MKTVYLIQSSPVSAEDYIKDVDFPVVPVHKEDGGYGVYDL